MAMYLAIVGTVDNPLYETTLFSTKIQPSASAFSAQQQQQASPSQASFSIFGSSSAAASSGATNSATRSNVGHGPKYGRHVMQLVAHASMDVIEDVQFSNGYMYLKSVDKFYEWTVSAWITPGGIKLILLHDFKQDDSIRLFLHDCWEAYVKHLLNPFYSLNAPIRSLTFDAKIKQAAKKHL